MMASEVIHIVTPSQVQYFYKQPLEIILMKTYIFVKQFRNNCSILTLQNLKHSLLLFQSLLPSTPC